MDPEDVVPHPAVLGAPAHRVSPRAVPYWRARAALGWLVLLSASSAAWLSWLRDERWVPVALAVLGVWAVVHVAVMPGLRYRVHRWEATATAVRAGTGWLTREQRIVPLSRVQTVDSTEGVLMRAFGLARVTVTTASSAGAVVVEGLDRATAEEVVARLAAVTAATPGDAT